MILSLDDVKFFLQLSVVGLCTGFGSAIGNYFAQRAFIKHFNKLTTKT